MQQTFRLHTGCWVDHRDSFFPCVKRSAQMSELLKTTDRDTGHTPLMAAACSGSRQVFKKIMKASRRALVWTEVRHVDGLRFGVAPACMVVIGPKHEQRHSRNEEPLGGAFVEELSSVCQWYRMHEDSHRFYLPIPNVFSLLAARKCFGQSPIISVLSRYKYAEVLALCTAHCQTRPSSSGITR